MLRFKATINEDKNFVLQFDPEYRDAMVLTYAKAKGYQETIQVAIEDQENVPTEFRIAKSIANPMTPDAFICKLIEQSIANVLITPELDKAVEKTKLEVLDSMKRIIPL